MSWICPHCGTTATIQISDSNTGQVSVVIPTASDDQGIAISWVAIKCPSPTCQEFVLDVTASFGKCNADRFGNARSGSVTATPSKPVGIGTVRFEPRVGAQLSVHVPTVVKNDYEEAYLIKDLSPKAAATLCRRALQGMIRDFHNVTKPTLHEELTAIRSTYDHDLFGAMMGLKGIGNIGAHPEKDINLIVDVEEGEVDTLLELLRILDKEWYVARSSRLSSLAAVKSLAATKAAAKTVTAAALPAPPSVP